MLYLDCWRRILSGHVGREHRGVEGKHDEGRGARHKVEDPRRRRPHRHGVVALQEDHGHEGEGVQHAERLSVGLKDTSLSASPLLISDFLQGVPFARSLGWVDLNFECSIFCPILPGLMGIWQKRLGRRARWWNTQIKVNSTQVHKQMEHPLFLPRDATFLPEPCARRESPILEPQSRQ